MAHTIVPMRSLGSDDPARQGTHTALICLIYATLCSDNETGGAASMQLLRGTVSCAIHPLALVEVESHNIRAACITLQRSNWIVDGTQGGVTQTSEQSTLINR